MNCYVKETIIEQLNSYSKETMIPKTSIVEKALSEFFERNAGRSVKSVDTDKKKVNSDEE